MEDEHGGDGGLIACSMRVVNAIPAVCAAPPGLLSTLDVPPVFGRNVRLATTINALDLRRLIWDHRSTRAGHERSVRTQGMGKVHQLGYVGISSLDLEAWRAVRDRTCSARRSRTTATPTTCSSRWTGTTTACRCTPARSRTSRSWAGRSAPRRTCRRVAAQLDAADVEVIAGKPELAADRRVVDLVSFTDPHSGMRMELHYGPEVAFWPPFQPRRARSPASRPAAGARAPRDLRARRRSPRPSSTGRSLGFGVSDWVLVPGHGAPRRVHALQHAPPPLAFFANPQPRKHDPPRDDGVHVDRRRGLGLRPRARARARHRDARSSPQRPHVLLLLQEPGRLALRARVGRARHRPRHVAGRALQRPAARWRRMGPQGPVRQSCTHPGHGLVRPRTECRTRRDTTC